METTISTHVNLTPDQWARLRRLAERQRTRGRASLRHVILRAVEEMLAREGSKA